MFRLSRFLENKSGFTLVELLLVITILGMMTAMILPVAFHVDDDAKTKETRQTFEAIRMAMLGPGNSFDAEGNRVIGGYVGDMGHLPKLYVYAWEPDDTNPETKGKWTQPYDSGDIPQTTNNANEDPYEIGDRSAQPLALWRNSLPNYCIDETCTDTKTLLLPEVDDSWKGPYLESPKDKFPGDQVWKYGQSDEEDQRFRLRECEGRLQDGWGRALIIYVEDTDDDGSPDMDDGNYPQNLLFVSAGSDGRYNSSDPADESFEVNKDNLIFKITQNEWDNTEEKIIQTRAMMEAIKKGMIDEDKSFIVDIGGFEPIFGSIVRDYNDDNVYLCIKDLSPSTTNPASDAANWENLGVSSDFPLTPDWRSGEDYFGGSIFVKESGRVYFCKKSHYASNSNAPSSNGNDWWVDLGDDTAGTNYPHVQNWTSGNRYFMSKLFLLQVNEHHVFYDMDTDGEIDKGELYQCATTDTSGAWTSANWQRDNSLTAPKWESNFDYFSADILQPWEYSSNCRIGAGWRGPYIEPQDEIPFKDAWGNTIEIYRDEAHDIYMRSYGPDRERDDFGTIDDDIVLKINRTEYEVPVTLTVSGVSGTVDVNSTTGDFDFVDVYLPFNGEVRMRRTWSGPIFKFNDDQSGSQGAGYYFILDPVVPRTYTSAEYAPIRSETADCFNTCSTCSTCSTFTYCDDTNDASCSETYDDGTDLNYFDDCGLFDRVYLPIGNKYFVFKDDEYTSDSGGTKYGSPYPGKDPNASDYAVISVTSSPGPPGYQKVVKLKPGSNATVELKNANE